MPEYTYLDVNGHKRNVIHRMLYSTGIFCECGEEMWRVPPNRVAVNWGGLSPSEAEEQPPHIKELYNDVERKREDYRERHSNE
jgi:hypothetical protein